MADTTPTDWGAALDGAAQTMGKPLANTPGAFASYYGPIADSVSQKTGIDSNTILGQWGLETGWGKSVIPGTNNLGNIKNAAGQTGGVQATDNQNGSTDSYQQFQSPQDFANAYSSLLQNHYGAALNTGTDAHATATALKNGGYAQDPNYVSKLTNAASLVAQARGQAPNLSGQGSNGPISTAGAADWDQLLDQAGAGANVANDGDRGLGFTPMSQFEKTYGLQQNGSNVNTDANPIVALGAGLGRGLQSAALGGQALVGKGLQAIGANGAGDWLVNDAQQGNKAGQQEYNSAAGDSIAGKVGQVVGAGAPALIAGPEILPQALAGAAYGGGNAALNNEAILPGAVEGAGLGAGGAALGQGIGAAVQGIKPLLTGAGAAVKGGEDAAAAGIANQIGSADLSNVINALRTNSDEIIPGSLPTAAEAGNNPALVAIQRKLNNTAAGQEAFPARAAERDAARFQAGQNAVGPSANNPDLMGPGLDAETQAFTQAQAQRVAQGQTELPPVSDAQAQLMQSPAYQRAINSARTEAQNTGVTAFADQSANLNQGLSNQIDQLAGTPDTLASLEGTRSAQAATDYAPVSGPINASNAAFRDLEARPGFNQALNESARIQANMDGSAAADAITTTPGQRTFGVQPDGTLGFTEGPAQRTVDAGILQGARSQLGKMAATEADPARRAGYLDTRNAIDNFLGNPDTAGPDVANAFNTAKANYTANSIPIDQQRYLQTKLAPAVNNLTGEVNPGTLNSTINSVARDQLKPTLQAADRITPQQVQALQDIGTQARAAPGNVSGLSGQGQELIRQSLEAQAAKGLPGAQGAADSFNTLLSQNSPAYAAQQSAQAGQGAALASRSNLAGALDDLGTKNFNASGAPKMTYTGAKQALNKAGNLQGVQAEYASNLLADLQRATAADNSLGAAGSQTVANTNLGGGLLGELIGHKINSHTIGTALATGHIGGALVGSIAQKILGSAGIKTEKAAIDLLLNPKQLANALEKFQNQPTAQQAFVDALKSKAASGGRAGVAAVQAYEASH